MDLYELIENELFDKKSISALIFSKVSVLFASS